VCAACTRSTHTTIRYIFCQPKFHNVTTDSFQVKPLVVQTVTEYKIVRNSSAHRVKPLLRELPQFAVIHTLLKQANRILDIPQMRESNDNSAVISHEPRGGCLSADTQTTVREVHFHCHRRTSVYLIKIDDISEAACHPTRDWTLHPNTYRLR
jgi:hypothetical protein